MRILRRHCENKHEAGALRILETVMAFKVLIGIGRYASAEIKLAELRKP
jgi:hypothetical protein